MSQSPHNSRQPAEAALLENPQVFLQNMFESIDALNILVDRETKLLSQPQGISEAQKLLGAKQELSRICVENIMTLNKAPTVLDNVDWSFRTTLEEKQKTFTNCIKNNMSALAASKSSVERLTGRIMEVTRNTVARQTTTYGSSGATASSQKPVSISINETT